MKGTATQSLGEFGPYLAMRPQGRRVQEALDLKLRQMPPGGVLAVDFDGVEMMDYSFADEALGAIYSRMAAREYPDRHLVLLLNEDELGSALLENIEVALNRREVAAIVLPRNEMPDAESLAARDAHMSTHATGAGQEANARRALGWRVVGLLPTHLVDTLRAVMDKGEITVRELADTLKLDSATACNNRIAKLYQMHLVRRQAAIVPEGGRQYCYSAVV